MILGDAGSSWCKLYTVGETDVRLVSTRELAASGFRFDWGTGHTARRRSAHFENDLIALSRGALALVDADDFTVLDLGSRDAKLVRFQGRRPVKLDWSVGCAAATGATLEMLGRFYEIDFSALEIDDRWTAVTCGTYAVEKVMDAIAAGDSAGSAVGRFVHGLARNVRDFSGNPDRLYLSGGFTENPAFLAALGQYLEVAPMGRAVPLVGLWVAASETGALPAAIPDALTRAVRPPSAPGPWAPA